MLRDVVTQPCVRVTNMFFVRASLPPYFEAAGRVTRSLPPYFEAVGRVTASLPPNLEVDGTKVDHKLLDTEGRRWM